MREHPEKFACKSQLNYLVVLLRADDIGYLDRHEYRAREYDLKIEIPTNCLVH